MPGYPGWIDVRDGCVTLRVLARPGASRVGALRADPRGLVVGIASAPERGKANAELIQAIARIAGVARSAVKLVAGELARQKTIRIICPDAAGVAAKLSSAAPPK